MHLDATAPPVPLGGRSPPESAPAKRKKVLPSQSRPDMEALDNAVVRRQEAVIEKAAECDLAGARAEAKDGGWSRPCDARLTRRPVCRVVETCKRSRCVSARLAREIVKVRQAKAEVLVVIERQHALGRGAERAHKASLLEAHPDAVA